MNNQKVTMTTSVWVLLTFACAAQALTSFGNDYHMVEDLHHELDDYVSGLQSLEISARTTLERVYEMEEAHVLEKHKANSEALLRLANNRKCQVPTLLKLNSQSESWTDRFEKCINLTQKFVNFENLTMGIYEEYLKIRPMICYGANNVSLCLTDKMASSLDKLVCSYDGIQGTIADLETTKTRTVELVEYIQTLVKDTVNDYTGCFGRSEATFLTLQRNLIDKSC